MRRFVPHALALAFAAAAAPAFAEPVATPVRYAAGDTTLAGYVVHDPARGASQPGLVMVPNWMGVTESALEKARGFASQGYVVFVADMYGEGVRPANAEEAGAAAGAVYADRPGMRARINAALDTLRAQAGSTPLDVDKVGAIGFCFGGATVLELARSGADVDGVVSFHGNLSTTLPAEAGALKAPVLALNGADDEYVPAQQIADFQAEMTAAGADWQFVNFAGAVHCFAEADANAGPMCQYHERSARRAYVMMDAFFDEAFAE